MQLKGLIHLAEDHYLVGTSLVSTVGLRPFFKLASYCCDNIFVVGTSLVSTVGLRLLSSRRAERGELFGGISLISTAGVRHTKIEELLPEKPACRFKSRQLPHFGGRPKKALLVGAGT